jgi:hypothetical protein
MDVIKSAEKLEKLEFVDAREDSSYKVTRKPAKKLCTPVI